MLTGGSSMQVELNASGYTLDGKWRLTPVEPTPSMIGAAWSRISADKNALGISRLGIGPGVGEWWAAMLLVAPLPPPTEKNDG